MPYTLWRKKRGRSIRLESSLEEITEATRRFNLQATPVDSENPTSPWITARPKVLKVLRRIIGPSGYKARAGACTWADGIYWLRILSKRPDGLLVVENMHDAGKRRLERIQAVIEPDLVYPFVAWRDIGHFRATPGYYILMVQDPEKRTGYDEGWLKLELPNTYAYLKKFEAVLR